MANKGGHIVSKVVGTLTKLLKSRQQPALESYRGIWEVIKLVVTSFLFRQGPDDQGGAQNRTLLALCMGILYDPVESKTLAQQLFKEVLSRLTKQ